MMPDVDVIMKVGSTACGLLSFFILACVNFFRGRENDILDLFIVGASGSSIPTGVLLVYSAFDSSIISKLSDAGVYIALAGVALLFIFYRTFKEKVSKNGSNL